MRLSLVGTQKPLLLLCKQLPSFVYRPGECLPYSLCFSVLLCGPCWLFVSVPCPKSILDMRMAGTISILYLQCVYLHGGDSSETVFVILQCFCVLTSALSSALSSSASGWSDFPWCQIWENVCPYEEGWSACAGNWFTGCNSACVRELEVYKRMGNVCSISSACCWALAKTKDFWVGNIILSKGVTQKSFHCKLVSEVRWKNVWTLYIMFWNILVGDLFLEAKQNSNKNCRQLGLT